MATRYWVGGAGTWDATTTTNWSATSGGASGASAPTSVDNVIFDTASNAIAYAVTVGTNAVAQDITIAGPAVGNVTITMGATAVINCYGSWTNAATGVVFSITGTPSLNFLATTTGKTITTNGVALGFLNVTFAGIGGGWTLGSAWTQSGIITINNGAFNTGNYSVTNALILSNSGVTRSITLGSSTLTFSNASPWAVTSTGLTLSAGTSTINCSNASPTFAGGGLTYYNVSFTSTTANATSFITGANTFNNLSLTTSSSGRRALSFAANQTISGILTLGATNAYNQRIQIVSTTAGSPITLTVATVATLADVDFRDVTAAGASAPWSGTRLGNGLGNTSITFAAGKTVYWNLVAGGNWSANAWATSSGGAVATANFPLAQDTAIIDNTGLTASNTITIDAGWWIGTLNATRTNAWTLAFSTGPFFYGDVTLASATTVTGTGNFNFSGQGLTQTLTTNGVSLAIGINQQSVGGTLVLNGAVTSTATVTLNNGTLNLNNFTLTTGLFSSSNSNTRTLAFGTGNIVLTGNAATIWTTATVTGLTVSGTPVVNATYSGVTGTRTITFGALSETNSISLNVSAGTDIVALTATGSFKNLVFTGFAGTLTNTAMTIYGNLTLVSGMTLTAGTGTLTFAATSGTNTITSATKTMDFPITFNGVGGIWACQDALTLGSTRALTITNGTLQLKSGTTSTVGSFVTTGTNQKFLQSTTPGTQATISDASGTNTVSYLTIQDIAATGGATWNAYSTDNNINAGNNTGWDFFAQLSRYIYTRRKNKVISI